MDSWEIFLLLLVVGYFCGSIPFGKIVGHRRHGLDIQKHGSGNIGFANSVRILGWQSGLLVLIGDIAKGLLPVVLARHYLSDDQTLIVAAAAIAGHVFPLWLRFKGGKGIATGLGVTLALSPRLGISGVMVYLIALAAFRKSAPSSIIATWSLLLFSLALLPGSYSLFFFGLGLLATWTHRTNLKNLRPKKAAS